MNKSRQIVILLALFLIGGITMVNAQDKPPLLDRPTVPGYGHTLVPSPPPPGQVPPPPPQGVVQPPPPAPGMTRLHHHLPNQVVPQLESIRI